MRSSRKCPSRSVRHRSSTHGYVLSVVRVNLTFIYTQTLEPQVLDENAEERERGVTMEVASRDFETKKTLVTLLDSPGHKDFVRGERERELFQNESITSITHTHRYPQ